MAAALVALLAAAPARAQTIRGTLMEFGSDEPIDLRLIIMISENGDSVTSTLANTAGFFEVTAPDPGNDFLQTAALGYRETQVGLFELGDGREISVQFRLWAAPLEIDGLMVESLVQQPELVRNGFYRRMQRGGGTFFNPEQVQSAPELRAIEMLQGLPGRATDDRYAGPEAPARAGCGRILRAHRLRGRRPHGVGEREHVARRDRGHGDDRRRGGPQGRDGDPDRVRFVQHLRGPGLLDAPRPQVGRVTWQTRGPSAAGILGDLNVLRGMRVLQPDWVPRYFDLLVFLGSLPE